MKGPHVLRLTHGRLFVIEDHGVAERDPETGALLSHRAGWDLGGFPPEVRSWCTALTNRWYAERREDDSERSDQWVQHYVSVIDGFRYEWANDSKDQGWYLKRVVECSAIPSER